MSDLIPWMEPWSGRALVIGVFIIGLIIAVRGIVRWRSAIPTCPRCGYNRSQSTSSTCPECGRECASPSELLRRPRRWRLVIMGLLVALSLPAFVAQRRIRAFGWDYYSYVGPIYWIDPFATVESLTIDNVRFRVERDRVPWSMHQRVIIRDADGHHIAADDTQYGFRRFGLVPGRVERHARMSRDARHVAVQGYSGGAHCCFTYWLYEVRDGRATPIAVLEAGNSEMSFDDVDADGIDELTLVDDTFAYWNACYACSPKPRVILRLADNHLALAADLMCSADLANDATADALDATLRSAWAQPEDRGDNGIPVAAWKTMLDLIYAGRAGDAFELLARTWPAANAPDRESFEQEFLAQMATSQWAEDLAAMNGGSFAERLMSFVRFVQQRPAHGGERQ